jgi:hypothetical protein
MYRTETLFAFFVSEFLTEKKWIGTYRYWSCLFKKSKTTILNETIKTAQLNQKHSSTGYPTVLLKQYTVYSTVLIDEKIPILHLDLKIVGTGQWN